MQEFTPLEEPERELERSLNSLTPDAGRMREQEIWYRAGLLAGRKRVNLWRGAAAAIVVMACLAMLARPRPQSVTVEHYVYVARPGPDVAVVENAPATPLLPSSYLALRNAVEAGGWRALGPAARPDAANGAVGQLPLRPIDEAAPAVWAVTQDRG
jgi:hypothetical protein